MKSIGQIALELRTQIFQCCQHISRVTAKFLISAEIKKPLHVPHVEKKEITILDEHQFSQLLASVITSRK
jgi:hypothetical protein